MSTNEYFDGVRDSQPCDEIVESAEQRARLRDARERLHRLEEIRDVALLLQVHTVEEISQFLQLHLGYVQRTNRLIELWRASGRDPFERKVDEFVLTAFVDHGFDDQQSRDGLVKALRAIVAAEPPVAESPPVEASAPVRSPGVQPEVDGAGDEDAGATLVTFTVRDHLSRLVSEGFLTHEEFGRIFEAGQPETALGAAMPSRQNPERGGQR